MGLVVCDICGNETDARFKVCPFCDSPLTSPEPPKPKPKPRITELLLKEGSPTVDEALKRLRFEIDRAKKNKISLLKVIHGYGSSGAGGAIKPAVESELRHLRSSGTIRNYITGEKHFEFAGKRNPLLRKYPELSETWITDRGNPGITFVEL